MSNEELKVVPKRVVIKDRISYSVEKWKLDIELYRKVKRRDDRLVDSFGVTYYHWSKDSNGIDYDRVGYRFPVKERGIVVRHIDLRYDEEMFILTSDDGLYRTAVSEKELENFYISTEEIDEYIGKRRSKVLLETCVDSVHKKTLEQATRVWGKEAQMLVMAEECAELTQAILKVVNRKREDNDNLLEELADVIIMANQMLHIFGDEKVKQIIETKMQKIKSRLEKRTSV